jgi:hypothetical protein
MAAPKYIKQVAGQLTELAAVQTSTVDAILALDGSGKVPLNCMPSGVGPEVDTIATTEDLAAGDFVDVYNSTGQKARKADATTSGKQADGFVLASTTNGQNAEVYFAGINNQCSGLTIGADAYLSAATAGLPTSTPPSSAGNIVQPLGTALSATEVAFSKQPGIVLA